MKRGYFIVLENNFILQGRGDMVKNRLLEIRLGLGCSKQKDFAFILGLTQQAYNKIENNKKQVTLEKAIEISEKLDIPVRKIFYKSNE